MISYFLGPVLKYNAPYNIAKLKFLRIHNLTLLDWTNNIMDKFSTEIIGVQNDYKRIVESTQSEHQPIQVICLLLTDVHSDCVSSTILLESFWTPIILELNSSIMLFVQSKRAGLHISRNCNVENFSAHNKLYALDRQKSLYCDNRDVIVVAM